MIQAISRTTPYMMTNSSAIIAIRIIQLVVSEFSFLGVVWHFFISFILFIDQKVKLNHIKKRNQRTYCFDLNAIEYNANSIEVSSTLLVHCRPSFLIMKLITRNWIENNIKSNEQVKSELDQSTLPIQPRRILWNALWAFVSHFFSSLYFFIHI